MSVHKDKVSDVIAILRLIKDKFTSSINYRNLSELRKDAIRELAESELRIKRYKDERSAVETLRDACARRLRPDIVGIHDFDTLVRQWLFQDAMILKRILLKHSINTCQCVNIIKLFQ